MYQNLWEVAYKSSWEFPKVAVVAYESFWLQSLSDNLNRVSQ